MKTIIRLLVIGFAPLAVHAADVSGTWKSEFNTDIGVQKYTFTLKQDGRQLTGKAAGDVVGEKHEVDIKEGKVDGDTISFVEQFPFQGQNLRISYTGKVNGDEMKLTRNVADFATEELVAKREKPAAAAAEPKPSEKSP